MGKYDQSGKTFDWGMHYFRAFAIICIVLLHAGNKFGYGPYAKSLLQSASVFFLFISGYLCQFIDLKKHGTPTLDYYSKKLKNVLLPYLVWTTLFLLMVVLYPKAREGVIGVETLESWTSYVRMCLTGVVNEPFWYIPFVMGLFAVSPFILRCSNSGLLALSVAASVGFLLIPDRPFSFGYYRSIPIYMIYLVRIYGHFTVFYLLGFLYARYKPQLDPWFKKYVWMFVALSVLLMAPTYVHSFKGCDLMNRWQAAALQKLTMIPVAIVVLGQVANRKIALLDNVANLSFTIFFVHMLFLTEFVELARRLNAHFGLGNGAGLIVDLMVLLAYLVGVYWFARLLKLLTGRFSRYLIGS